MSENGKGSRDRVTDHRKFRTNFDKIKREPKPALDWTFLGAGKAVAATHAKPKRDIGHPCSRRGFEVE